tara:strand:- start:367 stop:651 length:285 start_codon:yes stop_codon:yes gene_type:complete
MHDISYDIEIHEFLEQVNFMLSEKFKEKWRYRFSDHFISIFQVRLLKALQERKPVKKSTLTSLFVNKHKYAKSVVEDFYSCVDLTLYNPLIYNT